MFPVRLRVNLSGRCWVSWAAEVEETAGCAVLSSGEGRRGVQPPCTRQVSAAAVERFVAVLAQQSQCKLPVRNQRCHRAGPGEDSMSFTHRAFIRAHRVREGKSCLSSAPAAITELRENPAARGPFASLPWSSAFVRKYPLGKTILRLLLWWEGKSQASVYLS